MLQKCYRQHYSQNQGIRRYHYPRNFLCMPSFGKNRHRDPPTGLILQIPPSPTHFLLLEATSSCTLMSPTFPKHDSILDSGYWEDIKPEVKLSDPIRASTWSKRFLDFVRPSIFNRTGGSRKPLRRTAYLDGLRGFAAFMVYWGHHQLWARDAIHAAQ